MNRAEQHALIARQARELALVAYTDMIPGQGCLYFAAAAVVIAHQYGIELLVQAGTMLWPRLPDPTPDDPLAGFGYVYSGWRVPPGLRVPEIHCWAGCPQTMELVDVSTGGFPAACRALLGLPWLSPAPPEYLWTRTLPPFVTYRPDPEATRRVTGIVCDEVIPHLRRVSGL